MKSGHGSFSRKRTRKESTISTATTFSLSSLAAAPLYRSKENFTSSAVKGAPVGERKPLRGRKPQVNPALGPAPESARHRAIRVPPHGVPTPAAAPQIRTQAAGDAPGA